MAFNFIEHIEDVTIGSAATVSAAFQIKAWAAFVGIYLPAMDDGDIGLSVCDTSGGTYQPILDPADGADLVICASGSDAGYIDISDFIRFIPSSYYLKLTCASQTSGAVTCKLFQRG